MASHCEILETKRDTQYDVFSRLILRRETSDIKSLTKH